MWDLILSVPDHCLSFYFPSNRASEAQTFGNHHPIDLNGNICSWVVGSGDGAG